MKLSVKVILLWLGILGLYFVSLSLFPHVEAPMSGRANQIIQALLLSISLFIFIKEPSKKNRYIFLNFILYFALSIATLMYEFVGKAFFIGKFARHVYPQYVTIGYALSLSIAVVYLVIDLLFREFKTYQKYFATFVVVGLFFGYYFHPFISDPLYLYTTEDISQWKTLDNATRELNGPFTATELANHVTLQSWSNGVANGDLYPEKNLQRIEELLPYLEGDNWMVLLWKPMYANIIHIDVMLVLFILLFFGYQYKKDPPQGAYIEKIMFLILLLSSMDILHNWGFIKSVEWGSLTELFTIGQYITVFTELMMVLFFSLRLQFITSVQGEYYETELAANPHQVSRWRDWVDNLVLSQFFNFKIFNGRLFEHTSGK